MKKIFVVISAIIIMSLNCFAMTHSEFVSFYNGYASKLETMNSNADCLTSSQHIDFANDIYHFGIECISDGGSAALHNNGNYQAATNRVISKYESLRRKWQNKINQMGGSNNRNNSNFGDQNLDDSNEVKKKKPVGHANVGAKIWTAGDNANNLFNQNGLNPIDNQIQNNTIIDENYVYFDLGNMGSIQGPRVLELDNGKIEIISARPGMNIDEDGSYPYIELKYKATIYDSKQDALKFHLNNTEINVSVYDEITTYTFNDKGNYTIMK